MATYIKFLSVILGTALLALVMDVGFDQRLSELMRIPTTALTPADYRGITGLVLLIGIVMLLGLVAYCRAVLVPTWSKPIIFVACVGSFLAELLALMLDFHARPQMIGVTLKLVEKLGTPSIHQSAPDPEKSVETGAIPPPKKLPPAKKKPDLEPSFLTSPWAWLQWNQRQNQAKCDPYDPDRKQWCGPY